MKKLKLLIYAKSIDGGTGTFIETLTELKGIQIEIIVTQRPCFRKTDKFGRLLFFSQKNYPENYFILPSNLFLLYKEWQWFNHHLKRYSPNIILTVDTHCLLLATACKPFLSSKIKLMATIHNNLEAVVDHKVPLYLRTLINKLISRALNRADQVVCVSKGLAENLFIKYKLDTKPQVIYYGFSHKYADNAVFKPKKLVDSRKNIILCVGRFVSQKNFENIIKTFSLVVKNKGNTELWLVGNGPKKQEMEDLVKNLKIIDKVKFLGWQQELLTIYEKTDLFILSTNWEGLPYSIIEAMSQGLPIISTDTPFGPREILGSGKYGILVPMRNPQAMAAAIYTLLTNKKLYEHYSKMALERVKFFSEQKMLHKYKKLIIEVMNKKSKAKI